MSDEPVLYFNRELSWVEFNARVLEEGLREDNPLLERLRFMAITSANFDEFFMVRIGSLKRQAGRRMVTSCPAGLTPDEQLSTVRKRIEALVTAQDRCIRNEILPALARRGLQHLSFPDLTDDFERAAATVFDEQIFPLLTPIRVGDDGGLPFVGNLTLNILFHLAPASESEGLRLAMVPIPRSLDRVVWLREDARRTFFTLLETLVIDNASKLFPGHRVVESLVFRLTRDADLGVDEEHDEDFVSAMEEILLGRRSSFPVRLEIQKQFDQSRSYLSDLVVEHLATNPEDVYEVRGLIDPSGLLSLCDVEGFDHLRYEKRPPVQAFALEQDESIFDYIAADERMLHHPFDSFDPVALLLREAAKDPDVLAVKMTLYRTSRRSPIVDALIDASHNGKQVTVLVELKARFDEKRNIAWAQDLEKAGAIVLYGIAGLKVHAKALIIVRREDDGIKRYAHLSTGNYNDDTACRYTDIGLLTAQDDIAYDTGLFFNAITGYSSVEGIRRLVMAPGTLKARLLELIEREIARMQSTDRGRIIAKLNSLSDTDIVEALYGASRAGVTVELIVRGICTLVPGVPGMSENISVISIVGRFLEHSRIVYFYNGGAEELYLSSADWMPRNLERRVELMFPVSDPRNVDRLKGVLHIYLTDNCNAHELDSSGRYRRRAPDGQCISAQDMLVENARKRENRLMYRRGRDFTVRRKEG